MNWICFFFGNLLFPKSEFFCFFFKQSNVFSARLNFFVQIKGDFISFAGEDLLWNDTCASAVLEGWWFWCSHKCCCTPVLFETVVFFFAIRHYDVFVIMLIEMSWYHQFHLTEKLSNNTYKWNGRTDNNVKRLINFGQRFIKQLFWQELILITKILQSGFSRILCLHCSNEFFFNELGYTYLQVAGTLPKFVEKQFA